MILDSITLLNYGVYGGRQEINLRPVNAERPIILIGAMNGGGKTTLLDAVQLGFYGPKARCSARGRLGYKEFLRAVIHRGADPDEGAGIEIRFRRAVDGEMHQYRLQRTWRENGRSVEESIEVTKNGEFDRLLSGNWGEYIESYLPSGIAHLFFFDAEQIKELADGEYAAEVLGTAIHSLLGLDLVDRLESNLVALERQKRIEGKSGEEAIQVAKLQAEVEQFQSMLDEATQVAAMLQNEADQATKEYHRCQERFRQEGGELFHRRAELEAEENNLKEAIDAGEAELRAYASGPAPLLLLVPLLQEVEEQASRELESRKAQALTGLLEERDEAVLASLRGLKLPPSEVESIERVLRKDRSERAGTVNTPILLHAEESLLTELRHLQRAVFPDLSTQMVERIQSTADMTERLVRLRIELGAVPSEDAIAVLQRELQTRQVEREHRLSLVVTQEAMKKAVTQQLESAQAKLSRELGVRVSGEFDEEGRMRTLKHCAKVRATLERFRSAIVRKHASRIERLMLDSFQQLLRKTNLVTGLSIDPDSFQLGLRGADGEALPIERLSAGERQLLATSLLWGLARASGRPLPTIIDTPLGRLDSSHRRHLIERYFPVASHQVILLSTDEEIDQNHLERLDPYISRSYQLQFDETLRTTQVVPGYFWTHEATC